jgi:DNA sulfur modification protein DndC
MATTSLTVSGSRPRFGRRERTEIRAHFARHVLADMKAAYLGDDRPWVVGFSGGKDSTALVQFLYYMLTRLPANQRRKHVYVLASDTRVEAPYIAARIRKALEPIQAADERDGLPRITELVLSDLNVPQRCNPGKVSLSLANCAGQRSK